MIIEDLHGMDIIDAGDVVHRVVGEVRSREDDVNIDSAEFIVGRGKVLEPLVSAILHEYGLNPYKKWGNDGVICVIIE